VSGVASMWSSLEPPIAVTSQVLTMPSSVIVALGLLASRSLIGRPVGKKNVTAIDNAHGF